MQVAGNRVSDSPRQLSIARHSQLLHPMHWVPRFRNQYIRMRRITGNGAVNLPATCIFMYSDVLM